MGEVYVYVDLAGVPQFVGRLWTRSRKNHETASFEYDKAWLSSTHRFALEPALALGKGAYHTRQSERMFGAMGDSAPDRWGRALMRRAENRRARETGETQRTLKERDYLLGVNDMARQGALRFAEKQEGPYLSEPDSGRGSAIPPLIFLPRLLAASDNVINETESDDDLNLLLAPGASLGGARPKASILDKDGQLLIAKFPRSDDERNMVLWEAVALKLAETAGIPVSDYEVTYVAERPVLLLRRFDRIAGARVPYLSAMSMLGAQDHEHHSYLEIVDALQRHGAEARADMAQLWRRVVFNVLVSNTDDHLRNHGFLYQKQDGWRLSPAFDLNPVPINAGHRMLTTAIDLDDNEASLELALSVAGHFRLTLNDARKTVREVAQAVSTWRDVAAKFKLSKHEIERMSSAFEHRELQYALNNSVTSCPPGSSGTPERKDIKLTN